MRSAGSLGCGASGQLLSDRGSGSCDHQQARDLPVPAVHNLAKLRTRALLQSPLRAMQRVKRLSAGAEGRRRNGAAARCGRRAWRALAPPPGCCGAMAERCGLTVPATGIRVDGRPCHIPASTHARQHCGCVTSPAPPDGHIMAVADHSRSMQVLQRAPLGLYALALAASVLMWPGSSWKQVGPRVGVGTAAFTGAPRHSSRGP